MDEVVTVEARLKKAEADLEAERAVVRKLQEKIARLIRDLDNRPPPVVDTAERDAARQQLKLVRWSLGCVRVWVCGRKRER